MERTWISLVAAVVCGVALVGCGGEDTGAGTPAAPDAGPEAARPDAAEPAPTNRTTCGSAPHQELDIQVNQISEKGTVSPLQGIAQVTFSGGCDALTTDEMGRGTARLSTSTSPRSVKIVPPQGFVPSIYAERSVVAATESVKRVYAVFPEIYKAIPGFGWADDRGIVFVSVIPSGAGACATRDGVTVSVKGHPELTALYLRTASALESGASATTAYGFAIIPNAPPGEKLEILVNKPQCVASTIEASGAGLVPIEAGTVSFSTATLTDMSGPSCGPGPYVTMTGQVLKRSVVDFSTAPLAGVTAAWSNCPGVTAITREDGSFAVRQTKDTPFSLTLTKPGIIPYRLSELQLTQTGFGVLAVRGDEWKAVEPGWTDAGVSIYAAVAPIGTGPCASPDGVSVQVKDHPEAVAHYLDSSVPPVEVANATQTTTRGYLELTGVPAGTYTFDVATTKACKLSMTGGSQTGSLVALAGHVNIVTVWMENP